MMDVRVDKKAPFDTEDWGSGALASTRSDPGGFTPIFLQGAASIVSPEVMEQSPNPSYLTYWYRHCSSPYGHRLVGSSLPHYCTGSATGTSRTAPATLVVRSIPSPALWLDLLVAVLLCSSQPIRRQPAILGNPSAVTIHAGEVIFGLRILLLGRLAIPIYRLLGALFSSESRLHTSSDDGLGQRIVGGRPANPENLLGIRKTK